MFEVFADIISEMAVSMLKLYFTFSSESIFSPDKQSSIKKNVIVHLPPSLSPFLPSLYCFV